jgi:predicted flavoprotein YhiN
MFVHSFFLTSSHSTTHAWYSVMTIVSPTLLAFKEFDYVIVGGGTAGLVLAARLSEDPTMTVGVLEAGKSRLGDENVDSPAGVGNVLHNPEYDWVYQSTPQVCFAWAEYVQSMCLISF